MKNEKQKIATDYRVVIRANKNRESSPYTFHLFTRVDVYLHIRILPSTYSYSDDCCSSIYDKHFTYDATLLT